MTEESSLLRKLRKQLDDALARQKEVEAIEILRELIEADPKQPRWPHKRGDLYRKRNRTKEAVECYTQATNLYADQGFLARAIAMAKTVVDLDPLQFAILERLDPETAKKLSAQAQQPRMGRGAAPAAPAPAAPAPAAAARGAAEPAPRPAPRPQAAAPAPAPAEPAQKQRTTGISVAKAVPAFKAQPLPPHLQAPSTNKRESRVRDAMRRQASGDATPLPVRNPHPAPAPHARRRVRDISQSLLDMAEELTIAPDVQPNETRFSNAPPRMFDLTDDEMQPRTAATPPDSLRPAPPTAKKLSKLPLFPLFAELPQQALVELVKGAEVIELNDGATVVRSGELADALYGVVEGSVEIIVPGQQLRTTLAEGDVFGESSLLVGEKRRADVVVRGYLLALRIPREVFNQVFVAYPRLAELLLELLTRRLLANLLQSSPLFQEFDAHGRQQLVQVFEIRRAARGTELAQIGKVMDALYINLTGLLDVRYADGRAPEQHEAGTMFGQGSLLAQEPSDIGVIARSNMLVLRLPAKAFHPIAMQYPGMLAHVSELAGTSVARVSG